MSRFGPEDTVASQVIFPGERPPASWISRSSSSWLNFRAQSVIEIHNGLV